MPHLPQVKKLVCATQKGQGGERKATTMGDQGEMVQNASNQRQNMGHRETGGGGCLGIPVGQKKKSKEQVSPHKKMKTYRTYGLKLIKNNGL